MDLLKLLRADLEVKIFLINIVERETNQLVEDLNHCIADLGVILPLRCASERKQHVI
jgi:hypothetical protein